MSTGARSILPLTGVARAALIAICVVVTGVSAGSANLSGQSFEGSTASTAAGLFLGAYSGAVFGMLGTMSPCNRTIQGGRCTGSGASAGGAIALAMGGLIGAQNPGDLNGRFRSAGYGTLVGAVVGVGLRRGVRQYGWADVGAVAAVGGAIGAAPRGALIGAGVGLAAGAIVWLTLPQGGLPNIVMLTLGGLAIGGLYDWADGAANANRLADPIPGPAFSIPIG
jgi:hypothetical protein